MFTGIIEEIGSIIQISEGGAQETYKKLRISAHTIKKHISIGDSISINGVCQTVTKMNRNPFSQFWFEVESLQMTLMKTNFLQLTEGSPVNLETAMRGNKYFGGHIVSGHVESTAKIARIDKQNNNTYMYIELLEDEEHFIVSEGSIAINGVSLTIASIEHNVVMVNIIPHTFSHTTVQYAQVGDVVNIEYDMMIKNVVHVTKKYFSDENIRKFS